VPIPVGRAIIPPHRPALAKGPLGGIDPRPVPLAARVHEFADELLTLFQRKRGVAQAPKPAADDEVAAVRGDRIRVQAAPASALGGRTWLCWTTVQSS
jgi:hypothetical protein